MATELFDDVGFHLRNRSSDLYRIGPLYVGSVLTVNQAFPSVFGYPTQPLASDDGPSGGPAQLPPSGRTLDWFGPFPIVGVSKRLQRFERRENRLPLESRSTATPPFGGGGGGVPGVSGPTETSNPFRYVPVKSRI